jgi:hypothetical protein
LRLRDVRIENQIGEELLLENVAQT